jgi:hypothetical protein
MRYAISIVNYNCHRFLENQIRSLRRNLLLDKGDTLDIIVGDNSRSMLSRYENQKTCEQNNAIYIRHHFNEGDNSSHHALALNQIVNQYKDNFNALLIIDHDIFPFKKSDILQRIFKKDFVGLAQNKIGRTYLHPGLMGINLDTVKTDFDFLPCEGMDTGGKLCDILEKSNVEFLDLQYKYYTVEGYEDFYEIIDNTWMHYVKGSNWNDNKNHSLRLEFLNKELERLSA